MVKSPKIKENAIPHTDSSVKENCLKFQTILPKKTIGRLIKKLSFNAQFLSKFLNKRNDTVSPERDNPGNTAKP